MPIEGWPRIRFSSGGNITVTNNSIRCDMAIFLSKALYQQSQLLVLLGTVGAVVCALKFNANTEIITVIATTPVGCTCMPSPLMGGYKLANAALSIDKKMGGYLQVCYPGEIGMCTAVESVTK